MKGVKSDERKGEWYGALLKDEQPRMRSEE